MAIAVTGTLPVWQFVRKVNPMLADHFGLTMPHLALYAFINVSVRHIITRVTIPKFEHRWDRLSAIERNSKSNRRHRHGNGPARRLLVRLE